MGGKRDVAIRCGTEKQFANLGLPDADTHLLKMQLMNRVQEMIQDRNLNQTNAARIVGVSQPDLSRMLKGQFRDVSVERVMRMLTRLGCVVDIVVRRQDRKRAFAAIRLSPAA